MPLAPLICMSEYYGAPTPWRRVLNERVVLNDKTFMDQYTSVSSTLNSWLKLLDASWNVVLTCDTKETVCSFMAIRSFGVAPLCCGVQETMVWQEPAAEDMICWENAIYNVKCRALPCRISFLVKFSIWYIDYIPNQRYVDNFNFSIADCNLDVENSIWWF